MAKRIGLGAGIVVVVALMIGTALFMSRSLKSKPSTCPQMGAAAASDEANASRHVDVFVELAGDTDQVSVEAKRFVQAALKSRAPADRVIVKVTLVNGSEDYRPTGAGSACVGQDLVVSASDADLQSYAKASREARPDVAIAIERQYDREVDLVADAVANAVRKAPSPTHVSDVGAFSIWPFVARVPANHEVAVLAPFVAAGDNCLTIRSNPASVIDGTSRTLIDQRVQECVSANQVKVVPASDVRLTGVQSLTLSGPQNEAQESVIEALCRYATADGCQGGA